MPSPLGMVGCLFGPCADTEPEQAGKKKEKKNLYVFSDVMLKSEAAAVRHHEDCQEQKAQILQFRQLL